MARRQKRGASRLLRLFRRVRRGVAGADISENSKRQLDYRRKGGHTSADRPASRRFCATREAQTVNAQEWKERLNTTMKKTVGTRIIEGLTEFAEALESGEPLETRLTGHRLSIDLMPRKYRPRDVRATRRLLGASQSLFARFLGVALGTVRAWEQGRNVPNGAAARLLDEIRLNPGFWKTRFASVLRRRTTSPPRAVRRGKLRRVRVAKTSSGSLLTHSRGRKMS